MPVFDTDIVLKIVGRAQVAGLHQQPRELLLAGIDPGYADLLQQNSNELVQLQLDVTRLNIDDYLGNESFPLLRWLKNAGSFMSGRPDDQKYFTTLIEEATTWLVKAKAATDPANAPQPATEAQAQAQVAPPATGAEPERILFKSNLLPAAFLRGALGAADAVCRIEVQRVVNGHPETMGGGMPVLSLGSGWLIGPRHVMTNHHVVAARAPSIPVSTGDLDGQVSGAKILFGYDGESVASAPIVGARLCCADEGLDFALLELIDAPGIAPLPLSFCPIQGRDSDGLLQESDQFAVNIIQHPHGAAKQVAIRNNLAVAIDGNLMSYLTDTDKGSSGSPVCDDRWRVLALHRAADRTLGQFNFQGKTTAWINRGTRIEPIVSHLRDSGNQTLKDIWTAIGATIKPWRD